MADFTMAYGPDYTLADYIKGRRAAAKALIHDAKLKADQIEHEMAMLETQTKAVETLGTVVMQTQGVDRAEFQQGLTRVSP